MCIHVGRGLPQAHSDFELCMKRKPLHQAQLCVKHMLGVGPGWAQLLFAFVQNVFNVFVSVVSMFCFRA